MSVTGKTEFNTLNSKALFELQCLNEIIHHVGSSGIDEVPATWLDYFSICIERVAEIVDEAGRAG